MNRQRKKKKQKKTIVLKFIIFIFLLSAVSFFIINNTNIFLMKSVLVQNNHILEQEEIVELSGIILGTNIFKIKTKDIESRIKTNPYIKNVQVKRKLPDKISITIQERKEVASVFFLDHCIVLDEEGYALKTVETNPHLTIIDEFPIEDFTIGEKLKVRKQKRFEDVLNVIIKMKENNLFFKKIAIEDDQIVVSIYDKLYCKTDADTLINNMETLGEIIYNLHTRGIKRGMIKVEKNGYFAYSPVR